MSPTILCSTGILTREPDHPDYKQILEHGSKLGTAFELSICEAWYGHLDEVVEDLPGEGALDLQGFLSGLVERGYGGAITLEVSVLDQACELDEARLEQIASVVRDLAGS